MPILTTYMGEKRERQVLSGPYCPKCVKMRGVVKPLARNLEWRWKCYHCGYTTMDPPSCKDFYVMQADVDARREG